ncbi:hypothetical protein SNEBB_010877, partial [Seison nebaliae]
ESFEKSLHNFITEVSSSSISSTNSASNKNKIKKRTKMLNGSIDILYFFSIIIHVIFAVAFDAQSLCSCISSAYPTWLKEKKIELYSDLRDGLMLNEPDWVKFHLISQFFVSIPAAIIIVLGFLLCGRLRCQTIRSAALVYSSTVMMATAQMMYCYCVNDKIKDGPRTKDEKNLLLAVYLPFVVINILALLRFTIFDGKERGMSTCPKIVDNDCCKKNQ